MDKLKAMQIFVRVVETNSFSRAAESLGMPRAGITIAVQRLEKLLQVKLLNRNTRTLNLTDEGVKYFNHCNKIIKEIEVTESEFQTSTKMLQGSIKVEVTSAIARHVLIPNLRDFELAYPDIKIAISSSDNLVDLIKNGVDCAIRVGHLQDSTLIAKNIGYIDFIICGSPLYFSTREKPTTIDDLKIHKAVRYCSRKTGTPLDWVIKSNDNLKQIDIDYKYSVNDADSYLECGIHGLGLIMPAKFMAEKHIVSGELINVLPSIITPKLPISIVYPQKNKAAKKVTIFNEWVASIFQKKGFTE
ncbi:hypothetical protein AR325_25995 (plasmid) [Serratia marcescens]|uniref:LysR family transcriptional regulator n=1 Tax=Serratia marcescens TaxID=615 RepID=UPI0006ECCF89|nr:LysR family transcriptional regulator [Serratia marcescens]ALL40474.1 hypothetical protein AR325_25995 [Serratia marcescens]